MVPVIPPIDVFIIDILDVKINVEVELVQIFKQLILIFAPYTMEQVPFSYNLSPNVV